MSHIQLDHSEVFLVHQDGLFAKVSVTKTNNGWSVHVVEVQQPNGNTISFGRGLGVPGSLEDAREAGIRTARLQIAQTLRREINETGHVLQARCQQRSDGTGYFDAYVEVSQGDSVVHRHLMEPVPSRQMADREAIDFAAQLLRHVTSIRGDGTLVI
ncbi:hypothetical protein ABE522_06085 [Stenotrophomonas pennii]|uniref:hypothetical protein n=1 Tax=Stenotrophomonas lacuserhaii TaxID=2760084 RepID=UPI003209DB9B